LGPCYFGYHLRRLKLSASAISSLKTTAFNNSDIDAELHAGVQQYWSTNSRGDVQIEDVRQLPEELLFGMRQTDPVNTAADVGASDFSVYFDPAQLAEDRGTAG